MKVMELFEYYDIGSDKFHKAQLRYSRRSRMTLRHLHKLRKMREMKSIEMKDHKDFVSTMYGEQGEETGF